MNNILRVALCALAIFALTKGEKRVALDTALFMRHTEFKSIDSINQILSSVNVEDLSDKDIKRLAAFAGMLPAHFKKEYCVEV